MRSRLESRASARWAAWLAAASALCGCAGTAAPVDPSEYEEEQSVGSEMPAAAMDATASPAPEAGPETGPEAAPETGPEAPTTVASGGPPAPAPSGDAGPAAALEAPDAAAPVSAGEATQQAAVSRPATSNQSAKTSPAAAASNPPQGSVTVEMVGFEHAEGQVLVALWRTDRGFPEQGRRAFGKKRTRVRGKRAKVTFKGVPPGPFAVVAHHDEDKDFQMDTGAMGIPAEGYGFSRDASGSFGPPSFKAARLLLGKGQDKRVRIQMRY